MASEMIQEILKAEAAARKSESAAQDEAREIIEYANSRADALYNAALETAKSEAALFVSEAELAAEGIIKQANRLADLREKKVISEMEKKYDEAIDLVLKNISSN